MMSEPRYFAQFGEDMILDRIFRGKGDGVCIEVGGYDGITGSNSYYFEQLGWRCIVVEPMPDYCEKIRSNRRCEVVECAASDVTGSIELHVAEGVETLSTVESNQDHFARIRREGAQGIRKISVQTHTLDEILAERQVDKVDFITIDVEGHEMSVLRGLSLETSSPRVIIVEDNSGCTDDTVERYLERYSYVRFRRTGCNDWYARRNDTEIVTLSAMAVVGAKTVLLRLKAVLKRLLRALGLRS